MVRLFWKFFCNLVYCEHFLLNVSIVSTMLWCYFSYMEIHSTCTHIQAADFTETMLVIGWQHPCVSIFSSYCACNYFATSQYFCSLLQTNAALIPQKLLELHQLEDTFFQTNVFVMPILWCNPCTCLTAFTQCTVLNGRKCLQFHPWEPWNQICYCDLGIQLKLQVSMYQMLCFLQSWIR